MEERVIKISELEPVDTLYDGCCMPLVQYGETKKIEYATLKSKLNDDLDFVKNTDDLEERMSTLENNEEDQNQAIRDLRTGYAGKVDKVIGKGLSTNDYTNAEKSKVAEIDNKADISDIPTKTSDLTNDSGFIDSSYHDNSKQDVNSEALNTTNKAIVPAINEVNSIAKGANQAVGFSNYQTLITALNALDEETYKVGQNMYVVTTEVPDLWVSSVEDTSSTYTYTTDEQVVNDLQTNGYIQAGYYRLSMLETQKVDLTNYVKDTDYATSSKGGVFKTSGAYGTFVNTSNGIMLATIKTYVDYGNAGNEMFISKGTLENVLNARIGDLDTALDTINGEVI